MGGVPLRETVVKQVQAAGVPVWHRLAPRHWHRHATGAELCFRAIFLSLAIAFATVSTAAVQHNLQKQGTVACAKAISEQNCWILQRSIKCFSERLPACTTQPSLSTFLPTAFDTKFCETVLILAAGGKCKVGLSSVGWAEAELGGHFHFQAARGQTPPADPNFSFLEAKLCLHTFLLISCVHRRLCFLHL